MYSIYCCAYARPKGGMSRAVPSGLPLKGRAKRASAKRLLWTPGSGNFIFGQTPL